jgi:hypothetical protein
MSSVGIQQKKPAGRTGKIIGQDGVIYVTIIYMYILGGCCMDQKKLNKTFKYYLGVFTEDKEMAKILNKVTFQDLFNPKFLQENSKFTSMDDMIWRSGFGIMNLLEVENVNQEKWNEYIAANTECTTWHDFGKLAMIDWMKNKLEELKKSKH